MAGKLSKVASGIPGFDEISQGGIPKGRTTLISGISGSGKTAFSAQFLYKGITDCGENGVFVTFEEAPADIIRNTKSFGWNIDKLVKENKWAFVDVSSDDSGSVEVGRYDLGAFLARIAYAVEKVKAKRVVIDSVAVLFTSYQDQGVIRRELHKLAANLKKSNVTGIITTERQFEDRQISRYGVEEFVSDNVILLHSSLSSQGERERTIEVLKFRGSSHDSEEVPMLVTVEGVVVYPRLKPKPGGKIFLQKISTGIKGLDKLLCGGVYKNSSTLITGASGSGKTITALHFIVEGAKRGEKSLFVEFEESPDQLYRNAASFGWDLEKYVKKGLVKLICHYPAGLKAEQYLKLIQDTVLAHKAKRIALDSISDIKRIYNERKFHTFVTGLSTLLKMTDATSVLTNTTPQLLEMKEISETHLSTAADNIIILKYVELEGRMHRVISVLKQRGSKHEKDLMEFEVTSSAGITVLGPFKGIENLMNGTARRILQMELGNGRKEAERDFIAEAAAGKI
ncbi:MAG: circadian clock protein KaiC [Sedimentisphaerales bacterium]|nr:circadian clock protein KaiC [Sedimentisphaerales bacterium]